MLLFALLLATAGLPAEAVNHQRIDIPLQYRGTWALSAKFCGSDVDGPAVVRIGARELRFYEESGYLVIAQLNEVDDPPEFFGKFAFVKNLSFFDEVVRLDMKNDKLFITRDAMISSDQPTPVPWFKCSATPSG